MYTNYWKCITNLFIFIMKNSPFQICLFYSRIKRDIAVLHKKIPGGKYMRLRNIRGSKETIATSDYVVQEPETHKGTWGQLFGNEQPVQIEVGMGKGRFIMDMARLHPDRNFVGIEIYDSVLLRAVQKREQLEEDPWPKERHAKRRLTSRRFLERYDKILAPEGTVEFKTDNRPLFEFSLEEVKEAGWVLDASTFDLHHDAKLMEGNVMTEYEEKFSRAGNPIHKMIIHR